MESVERVISEIVTDCQGIRATELAAKLAADTRLGAISFETLMPVLTSMVQRGELVEVEYVLPTMNYRIKSIYFPKGTEVTVVEQEYK